MLVRECDGTYEMQPGAAATDWERVLWGADYVEHIEDLTYWGEWTAAYRVKVGPETLTYFVAEEEYSPEARQALADVYGLRLELAREPKEIEDGSEGEDQDPSGSLSVADQREQG